MTFTNPLKAAENLPVLSTEAFQPSSHPTFGLKPIFIGPNGLRGAGGCSCSSLCLPFYLEVSFSSEQAGFKAFGSSTGTKSHITITPLVMGGSEAITLLFLCIAALVMGKLEHRKFSEYGLPLRLALRKDFWIGSLTGFLAISGTLLTMFLQHTATYFLHA